MAVSDDYSESLDQDKYFCDIFAGLSYKDSFNHSRHKEDVCLLFSYSEYDGVIAVHPTNLSQLTTSANEQDFENQYCYYCSQKLSETSAASVLIYSTYNSVFITEEFPSGDKMLDDIHINIESALCKTCIKNFKILAIDAMEGKEPKFAAQLL